MASRPVRLAGSNQHFYLSLLSPAPNRHEFPARFSPRMHTAVFRILARMSVGGCRLIGGGLKCIVSAVDAWSLRPYLTPHQTCNHANRFLALRTGWQDSKARQILRSTERRCSLRRNILPTTLEQEHYEPGDLWRKTTGSRG